MCTCTKYFLLYLSTPPETVRESLELWAHGQPMTDEAKQADLEDFLNSGLGQTVKRLGEALKEKAEGEREQSIKPEPEKKTERPSNLVQLPLWPKPTRGTPNSFLRGALFAATQGKKAAIFKTRNLSQSKGFTWIQLDQSDLDVWEQAAMLAQHPPLGNGCHFHIG